ncbi:hypothetical protein [Mucilaginibacter defluvii]|uniref:PepSY-like beta-lactamase-inhibitor n=1 Tax=Mucilaginibacter defluvii TaxID=1196019 RepID=A0ABP9G570_9SPHI
MRNLNLSLLRIYCVLFEASAQRKDLSTVENAIVSEAKVLYNSEWASWYGTDIFMAACKDKANTQGGYLSKLKYLTTKLAKMKKAILVKTLLMLTLPITLICSQISLAKSIAHKNVIVDSINKEYLPISKMRICGKLPMESNLKKLKALFGKPDSIVTPDMNNICTSYYERKFEYYYTKGICFEKYGDAVVFSSVNFTRNPNTFLAFDKIRLDGKTHLNDIKKNFPGADVTDIKTADGTYTGVRLALSKTMSDDSLLLLFDKKTGVLAQVSYYMPC